MTRHEMAGHCPVHVISTDDTASRPTILLYMDAIGIRPGLLALADSIARDTYRLVVPDLFHRLGPYGPLDPKEVFAGDFRATVGPMMASTDHERVREDTAEIIAWLDQHPVYAGAPVGVVGFCMGGGFALTAAGRFPDRVVAAASFHGGNLATDLPSSSHLLASRIEASVYIAAAADDATYPPAMAARLEEALRDAKADFTAETYPAKHGWMVPDHPAYDPEQAARGLRALSTSLDDRLA